MNTPVKIIAEAGTNHNGNVQCGIDLIDAAKSVGADMIKFQCFVPELFMAPDVPMMQYFKDRQLGLNEFERLRDHADGIGITMISTGVDSGGIEMVLPRVYEERSAERKLDVHGSASVRRLRLRG